MSVNREEFAEQQASLRDRSALAKGLYDESRQKERTVEKLVEKMLRKNESIQAQQNSDFNNAVRDINASTVMDKGGISKDVKAIVDKIGAVQSDSTNTKSIGDVSNLKTRIKLISKLVEENDNIKGVELDQINNMIGLVKEQINSEKKARHGFVKGIGKSVASNLPDTASLIAGVVGDSPALMFMTKMLGDFVQDKWKKRKDALAEKREILATQLDSHQEDAYKQRENQTQAIRDLKQNLKDESNAKLKPEKKQPAQPKLVRASESESESENVSPIIVRASETETETVAPIMGQTGESVGMDVSPMVAEQQQTNTILDNYISTILRGNMNNTEERRESEARQNKLFGMFGKKDGKGKKVKGKGVWGKLFSGLPSLLGLGSLGAILTGVSTFITATAIPAIGGFLSGVAGLIAPILAGVALLAVVTKMFTNFFGAGEALGKDEADVTIMDRVASMIGGIMEGFASIADFIAGLFGFDTKLEEWWNLNFTRPLADFFANFSLTKMWDGLVGFVVKIGKLMVEYSPIGLFMKGLNYLSELFDLEPLFQPVTDIFASIMGVFDKVKDFILKSIDKLIDFIWEYSPFGLILKGIKMISDSMDFDEIFKQVKAVIDGMVPDFFQEDTPEQKAIEETTKANNSYVKDILTDQGVVNHNIAGNSKITDWDAVAKMAPENIQKIIDFDDFSDADVERLQKLKGKPIVVAKQPAKVLKQQINEDKNIEISDVESKLEMAESNDQPVLQYRAEQTDNIERSVKKINDAKEKKETPVIASNTSSPVTNNQHTTINNGSTPFNEDRGINSLQAVFQS